MTAEHRVAELVDETSVQRGHKYVTVIKNEGTGHVLDRFHVVRCGGHGHRLGRRNPCLASHRPAFQRTPRRNQQPPPSPAAHRPRIHQPLQLRSPRAPANLTTHRQHPHPPIPQKREGPKTPEDGRNQNDDLNR